MGDESEYEKLCTSKTRDSGQRMMRNSEEKEIKVMITFVKQAEQYMHPVKLSKVIEKVGSVKGATCLSNGRVLIKCKDENQKAKILKLKTLAGGKISCAGIDVKKRGVISAVPLNVTMEEVKGNLIGGKVALARRLTTWKDNEKCDSLSVTL